MSHISSLHQGGTSDQRPARTPGAVSFCAVPIPTIVYASPRTFEEFERLPLEASVYDWQPDEITPLLTGDGLKWERRCHAKSLEANGVTVVFQWFDRRVVQPELQAVQA